MSRKRKRTSEYEGIIEAVFCWFIHACSKNAPVTGDILKQKAKDLVKEMNIPTFWFLMDGYSPGSKMKHRLQQSLWQKTRL